MAFLKISSVIVPNGGKWTIIVRDIARVEHIVYVQPEYIRSIEMLSYIPVAVCGIDRPRRKVLIEFPPESTVAVSRIWVPISDIHFDESHAFTYPENAYFPIVRVEALKNTSCWEKRIRVVDIEKTAEAAQQECDRLNSTYGRYGLVYFWHSSKPGKFDEDEQWQNDTQT